MKKILFIATLSLMGCRDMSFKGKVLDKDSNYHWYEGYTYKLCVDHSGTAEWYSVTKGTYDEMNKGDIIILHPLGN